MDPLNLGKLSSYVNDFSQVLLEPKRVELNELFAQHERATTEQVVVVLFPHRDGNELYDIGMKIFEENGIWQKGTNNGLLLMVSTDEKKIRIMTGKGMDLEYTEMVCQGIIEKELRPLLNAGKYSELIETWSKITRDKNALSDFGKFSGGGNTPFRIYIISTIMSIIFSLVLIDSITSAIVGFAIASILFTVSLILRSKNINTWKWLLIASIPIYIFALFGLLFPSKCTLTGENFGWKQYDCTRTFFGSDFRYSKSIGGNTSSYTSNSSRSNGGGYSSNGGSSSFGGGGWSSNGGGGGD
jgi:uncharacterized membrane protein YgcG